MINIIKMYAKLIAMLHCIIFLIQDRIFHIPLKSKNHAFFLFYVDSCKLVRHMVVFKKYQLKSLITK